MSDLTSIFNEDYGWPNGSALAADFVPKASETMPAGTIVKVATNQLRPASVLRMVSDADQSGSDPVLTVGDAGKAYEVNNWATQTDGDIVEWTGTAWVVVVTNVTGAPPDGTRAVVVEASAAGSFAGGEEKVWTVSSGTWTATDVPADGAEIGIFGTNSLYNEKEYRYAGTHATGAWAYYSTIKTILGFVQKMTSAAVAGAKQAAWVVLEGNDQYDSQMANKVTAAKLGSGVAFRVKTAVADTLAPGDYVEADAGLIVKCDGTNHAIGQVLESNGVAGATGEVVVQS